jgi:16S rRNA (cytosine967-C5)-methyltransferase
LVLKAREIALAVLKAVEEGAYANIALDRFLERHRPHKLDRALATELSYGVLRSLNTLDWVLASFVRQPLAAQTPWVRNILRLGAYQLLFMDHIPDAAACNEAVELAKKYGHPGAEKFVNAVLRNVARRKEEIVYPDPGKDPVAAIALRHSHPIWLVERWLREFGFEETVRLCRANNRMAPNTVRTNTLRVTREELCGILREEGVQAAATPFAPEGLELKGFVSYRQLASFRGGLFQIQDESSMLVPHAAAPAPGSRVLDACGAPGGKATHFAQLIKDTGDVLLIDLHPHKLRLAEENCRRLGITCVRTRAQDARRLSPELAGWADVALVDAPCSGLGVLRRRPDARWRKTAGQIPGLVRLQAAILDSVAAAVRPGGVLVYSTCTITEEENYAQVRDFVARHPDYTFEDLRPFLPAGLDLRDTMRHGYLQVMPHDFAMDGFFVARLRKRGTVVFASI